MPIEIKQSCDSLKASIGALKRFESNVNNPFQLAMKRRKEEEVELRDKIIQQVSLENTKRLRRVLVCKHKLRSFRRWET
jgi:hypothetical protein